VDPVVVYRVIVIIVSVFVVGGGGGVAGIARGLVWSLYEQMASQNR
jgi:hypothetical protein